MLKLRPHHLMCTQGYSGKGYDDRFVSKMNEITSALRSDGNTKFNLIFGADDICSCCPRMQDNGVCMDIEKVQSLDEKMIRYFNLKEQEYIYSEIIAEIKNTITGDMMDDICSCCEWYSISSCKKNMIRPMI